MILILNGKAYRLLEVLDRQFTLSQDDPFENMGAKKTAEAGTGTHPSLILNQNQFTYPSIRIGDKFYGFTEVPMGNVSDGYHTFDELYDHRITNYILAAKYIADMKDPALPVWKSMLHSDGSIWEGWFILGVCKQPGKQITYHLPIERWSECNFASTLDRAPKWDGHISADVLNRLKNL